MKVGYFPNNSPKRMKFPRRRLQGNADWMTSGDFAVIQIADKQAEDSFRSSGGL